MSPLLEVAGLTKAFGAHQVLRGLDLDLRSGELAAVLGPSGCGKTTLLRIVAGFEPADAGRIRLAGRVLDDADTHLAAERRGVTVVPQDGALFPHLTVAQNVGFGLPRRQPGRDARIAEVLDLVGLDRLADRHPHQLSGGQQQRTAVARALAPAPALVLLDEPFSALDAGLRTQLRNHIREVLRADRATAVLVTHDQEEALSLADHVAVMSDGAVAMAGSPQDVYLRPTSLGVARFVGEVSEVFGTAERGVARTALGDLPIRADQSSVAGPGVVVLRPEQVTIDAGGTEAEVVAVRYFGRDTEVTAVVVDAGGRHVVRCRTYAPVPPSGRVGLRVKAAVSFFADAAG